MEKTFSKSQRFILRVGIILILLVILYGSNYIYKVYRYNNDKGIPLTINNSNDPSVYNTDGMTDEEVDKFIREQHDNK